MTTPERPSRWPGWLRRTTKEPLELKDVLVEPLPLGAADVPFSAQFGPGMFTELLGLVFFPATLIFLWFWVGVTVETLGWLLIAVGIGASLLLILRNATRNARSVRIDEGGIRAGRVIGEVSIPWWEVRAVDAEADASKIRVRSSAGSIMFDMSQQQAAEPRRSLVHALRARLEPKGISIQPWDHGKDGLDRFAPAALHLTSGVCFLCLFLFGLQFGGTLGLRCTTASDYLRQRFDTADGPGCIAVRVSAAAEEAGLRQGDLVIEMNGIPVTSGVQYSELFEDSNQRHFTFVVIRPGEEQPREIKVDTRRGGEDPDMSTDDPLFYYLRARWDASEGERGGPVRDYTKAIELEPDFDLAYLYRGQLLLEVNREQPGVGHSDIERARDLSPDVPEIHRRLAYSFLRLGQTDNALASARRAIELDDCEGSFTRYNVDCSRDYYALADVLAWRGEAGVGEATAQARIFYDYGPR